LGAQAKYKRPPHLENVLPLDWREIYSPERSNETLGAEAKVSEFSGSPKQGDEALSGWAMAQRMINAQDTFCQNVMEAFDFTREESEKILEVYASMGLVKLDIAVGKYNLKHGSYWDKGIMKNALTAKLPVKRNKSKGAGGKRGS
jgi:hypothetical protein